MISSSTATNAQGSHCGDRLSRSPGSNETRTRHGYHDDSAMSLNLNLTRWNKVWLSRPWNLCPVLGTSMIELHGVRGFLTPGDVTYLFNLAATLPRGGCYLEVGSWLGLSSIIFA